MGKVSRRRVAMASAVILAASAPLVVIGRRTVASSQHDSMNDSAAAPTLDASVAASTSNGSNSSEDYDDASWPRSTSRSSSSSLTTVFSCGTTWRTSQKCSTLCPTGDDSACPSGQHCYAGIPCEGGESSMEELLERQGRMEQQEMNRLKARREELYVERFVCGESYEEAEASCAATANSGSSPSTSSLSPDTTTTAHYCPTGSSSQCPGSMQCYASVSCPRHSHSEEVPLIEEVSIQILHALTTEAVLVDNSTLSQDLNRRFNNSTRGILVGEEFGLISEEWRSFFRESSSLLSGAVSKLLSSSTSHGGLLN